MMQWELGVVKERSCSLAKRSRGFQLQIVKITTRSNSIEENLEMKEHDQHFIITARRSLLVIYLDQGKC